jgi:tetratricopeptide (TPR) repeat protein
MSRTRGRNTGDPGARVERTLRKCAEWSRAGRHREIIAEADRRLPELEQYPKYRAALLVWKAQALLAMGLAERAQEPASQSWELEPSPHACHLTANALEALGDPDGAEELLRVGWQMFPQAVHLPVQLAVILSDQARIPEAVDILEEVPFDDRVPDDMQVFLFGMRSTLLAALGRWAEADELLKEGISHHPTSAALNDAHSNLTAARRRARAECALVESWSAGLEELDGGGAEVDDAIVRCGAVHELGPLVVLAARRLWRAYLDHQHPRPHVPDVWGAALVLAVLELDASNPPIAAFARSFACRPSSVRSVLARLRAFVSSLDREFAARAFAARTNPRLEGAPAPIYPRVRSAEIVPFPAS